jgi:hypothetical protein
MVWHEGYYPGTTTKTRAEPLVLKSGEERTLNIRLQPGSDSSDAGCDPLCFPHCRPKKIMHLMTSVAWKPT